MTGALLTGGGYGACVGWGGGPAACILPGPQLVSDAREALRPVATHQPSREIFVHLLRSALVAVLCGALVATVGPLTSLETAAASAAPAQQQSKPKKPPYKVTPGISFNSPIGSRETKNRINSKII